MDNVTDEIAETLGWMIADLNYRRTETGMEDTPLSPEMRKAMELHNLLVTGRIECRRLPS